MTASAATDPYIELKVAFDFFNARLFDGCLRTPVFTLQRKSRTRGYCSHRRFASRITGEVVTEIAMNPDFFATRSVKQTLSTLVHEMAHLWQFDHGAQSRGGYHNKEWASRMKKLGLQPSTTGKPGGKETGQLCSHYIIEGGAFDVCCDELLQSAQMVTWVDRFPAYIPPDIDPEAPVNQPIQKLVGRPQEDERGLSGKGEDGTQEDEAPSKLVDLIQPRGVIFGAGPEPDETQCRQTIDRLKYQLRTTKHKYACPNCRIQAWGKPGLQLACGRCSAAGRLVCLSNLTEPALLQEIAAIEEYLGEIAG